MKQSFALLASIVVLANFLLWANPSSEAVPSVSITKPDTNRAADTVSQKNFKSPESTKVVILPKDSISMATNPIDTGKITKGTLPDFGYFYQEIDHKILITREQILRSDATTLTEILQYLPGIKIYRNTFWAGKEEITWYGMRMQNIILTIDGVPYASSDLAWQNLPRISILSLQTIQVTLNAARYGGNDLLIECESRRKTENAPVVDALWQSGPFNSNLLDVYFGRKLGKRLDFFFHSRSMSVASKNYTQPDVITTFYESVGKDTNEILYKGFNPMQEVHDLRVGAQYTLGNYGDIYGVYSNLSETDTVFLPDTNALTLLRPLANFVWKSTSVKNGYGVLGFENIRWPLGNIFARLYQKENSQKGIFVQNRISNDLYSLETSLGKNWGGDSSLVSTPLQLSAQALGRYGLFYALGVAQIGWAENLTSLTHADRIEMGLNALHWFWTSDFSYSTAWKNEGLTYEGIPVEADVKEQDTSATVSGKAGIKGWGYSLWAGYARLWESRNPELFWRGKEKNCRDQLTMLGLNTEAKQKIQFGSTSIFANEIPTFEEHLWLLFLSSTMKGRLLYELSLSADYTSENEMIDFENAGWEKRDPFWDMSMKLSIQIRQFRMFYRIQNIFGGRRQYYAPYELPGLTFMWGIRWVLFH